MAKPCGFAIEFNPLGTPPLSLYSSTRDGAPHAGVDDGVAGAARCAWTGGRSGGVAHRASAGWCWTLVSSCLSIHSSPSTAAVLFLSLWIISTSSCTGRHDNFTCDENDDAGSNAERGVSGESPLWHALPHTSAAADLWAERVAVNGVPGGRLKIELDTTGQPTGS
jgi:hypothetical protein